jgi:hypothetical protein
LSQIVQKVTSQLHELRAPERLRICTVYLVEAKFEIFGQPIMVEKEGQ